MMQVRLVSALLGAAGLLHLTGAAPAADTKKAAGAVIAIQRGGGFVNVDQNPLAHYSFTVAKDGAWEFLPAKGASIKGKLGADEVPKWLKALDDGGFRKLRSEPALGAADEKYMDITVRDDAGKQQKRIRLEEKLAQALDKKILSLARPGK
jgi:hypothetical protein